MHFLDVLQPRKTQERRGIIGFLVFQSDHAAALETVLVIPCREIRSNLDLGKLTPKLIVNGKPALAMVPQMAGIERLALGEIVIGEVGEIRDELVQALDRLVTGF